MPNSPDAPVDSAAAALDWLRGRPNPFESLVRPQRAGGRFLELHVPGLLRAPREQLLAALDAYRLREYRSDTDLGATRVVTVLGARGAGKTHMLDAVIHRGDRKPQLVVRPTYVDLELPFEEYLLDQLVRALLADDPVHGGKPFLDIAAQLVSRLLQQAIRGLGPTERLFALAPRTRARWRLLWGGGEALTQRFEALLRALQAADRSHELPEVAALCGLTPQLLHDLLAAHVIRHEAGAEALSAIRRQLYLAMARTALLRDRDAFGQFLEADYQLPGARSFFRSDLVHQQIHALVEACALVQMPVVFALDNLEGVLAPHGSLDTTRTRSFMDGLAQTVDSTRGLLFVLFAEKELFRAVRKETHQFALDRIDQGVPVHARGPVDLIELQPPPPEEVSELITERVAHELAGQAVMAQTPPGFPFSAAFLQDLSSRRDLGLRNLMMRLRDEYSRVVYGRTIAPPEAAPPPPVDMGPVLERVWTERLGMADRQLTAPLTSLAPTLHVGLRRLLQEAGGAVEWQPADVRTMKTADGHAVYSIVTVVDWKRAAPGNGAAAGFRTSIGFLLAQRRGLPRDLDGKLALLDDTSVQADGLVVLWPRAADGDLLDELSADTRKTWNTKTRRYRGAELRPLTDDDLRKLLAVAEWQDALQSLPEAPVPAAAAQQFVSQRCQSLLALALPPKSQRTTADAN